MSFAIRTDRVRLVLLVKRKPGVSKEEFTRHWTEIHGPLFTGLDIVKKNLLKYEQAHRNDKMSESLQAGGLPGAEWDGMAIFEGESYEKVMEVVNSDEFKNKIIPDADNFMDVPQIQYIPLDLVTPVEKAPSATTKGWGTFKPPTMWPFSKGRATKAD
ncbi:hypothetical protein DFH06DRAFT_1230187 [Mycena polygramma]|nr:hypothetical protein DFH06DRAFT_1230187 [Mycena polygramma]